MNTPKWLSQTFEKTADFRFKIAMAYRAYGGDYVAITCINEGINRTEYEQIVDRLGKDPSNGEDVQAMPEILTKIRRSEQCVNSQCGLKQAAISKSGQTSPALKR